MDTPLIPSEKALLSIAKDNTQTVTVWSPHIDEIAKQMRLSRPRVFALLGRLEQRGLIQKWDGRAGVYSVLPEISEAVAAEIPPDPQEDVAAKKPACNKP